MKAWNLGFGVIAAMLLSACAGTPKPTYVSPTIYQSYDCRALQAEYNRIHQHIENGVEPEKRQAMGVGIGLGGGWGSGGWGTRPSVSINMGQSSNTKRTEIARLLGQQEAIVQAAKFKACPIVVRKNSATVKQS
jgi:hypothetical protein